MSSLTLGPSSSAAPPSTREARGGPDGAGWRTPQLAAEERLRRLAPLGAAVAALAFALLPGLPLAPTDTQLAAAALIACAAGLLAHAIAASRGPAGVVGGAAAGCWLAAVATTSSATTAASHVPTAAAFAAAAALAAMLARPAPPPIAAAPAACALAVFEPRAWALVAAVAALIALREPARVRRYLAIAPGLAALAAGTITLLVALHRAPTWAPSSAPIAPAAWLELAVDGIGPIALILAATGAFALAADRRARWLAAATAGSLAAFAPLTAAMPATALIGVALALGTTVTAAAARVGRPRHQLLTAGAISALMIAPFAL